MHLILRLLSVHMVIVQADAQAQRQARLEARVLVKLKKKGLPSLTTNHVAAILKQVYRVRAVVALDRF